MLTGFPNHLVSRLTAIFKDAGTYFISLILLMPWLTAMDLRWLNIGKKLLL